MRRYKSKCLSGDQCFALQRSRKIGVRDANETQIIGGKDVTFKAPRFRTTPTWLSAYFLSAERSSQEREKEKETSQLVVSEREIRTTRLFEEEKLTLLQINQSLRRSRNSDVPLLGVSGLLYFEFDDEFLRSGREGRRGQLQEREAGRQSSKEEKLTTKFRSSSRSSFIMASRSSESCLISARKTV